MTKEEAIHHLNNTGWLEERERIAIDFLDSIGCFKEHDKTMIESTSRPKGKWKMYDIYDSKGRHTGDRTIICNRCLKREVIRFGQSKWDFCPNCGADMRGDII